MDQFINYIIESGASIAVLVIIYFFLLRKETLFLQNRFYLMGSVLFSLMLPLLRIQYGGINIAESQNLQGEAQGGYLLEAVNVYGGSFAGNLQAFLLSLNLLSMIYLTGVVLTLALFLIRLMKICGLIILEPVENKSTYSIIRLKQIGSPFSFFNYVFIPHDFAEHTDSDRMLYHELEHVKQYHSLDVMIVEILLIVQWFNPFVWMIRRLVRENHEFIADDAVVKSGGNHTGYKKLLLDQFLGEQFQLANNFNYSLIKNRMKMITKGKSSQWANSKLLIGIAAMLLLTIAFACESGNEVYVKTDSETITIANNQIVDFDNYIEEARDQKIEAMNIRILSEDDARKRYGDLLKGRKFKLVKEIVTVTSKNSSVGLDDVTVVAMSTLKPQPALMADVQPEFPGGDVALRKYLAMNVKYPSPALENGIQGKVYVRFIVNTEGKVENARIGRGVDASLNKEAMRIVNKLPDFKPGTLKGKPVPVEFTIPINFVLK
ncbi:M56 family peptidase [Puteibacter caeruleilacunae]|nr:M56 family peptidase [Puteibacter caeruleilacunae]